MQDVKHGQTVKVKGYGIGKVATIGNTGCQVKMPDGEYLGVLFRDLILVSDPEAKNDNLCLHCLHAGKDGVCEFTLMVESQMNFCDGYDHIENAPRDARLGTSYIGQFKGTYARLVELFGIPLPGSADGKTDVEWCLKLTIGSTTGVEHIVTIYNWKNGPRYYGGSMVPDIKTWNVGSKNIDKTEAAELVNLLSYMVNESQIGR